jgi:hypothetical protein
MRAEDLQKIKVLCWNLAQAIVNVHGEASISVLFV